MLNSTASIQTYTHTHCYYNTVASHHMILHSRRYLCSATVTTNRHPLVPERVQLSSAQTLLAGRCLINTSCTTVNDATLALIQTTAVSTQSTNCQKAKEKLQTHRLNFTKDPFLHFLIVLDHAFAASQFTYF